MLYYMLMMWKYSEWFLTPFILCVEFLDPTKLFQPKKQFSFNSWKEKRWKFPVEILLKFFPQWTSQSSLPITQKQQLAITALEQPMGQIHQPIFSMFADCLWFPCTAVVELNNCDKVPKAQIAYCLALYRKVYWPPIPEQQFQMDFSKLFFIIDI